MCPNPFKSKRPRIIEQTVPEQDPERPQENPTFGSGNRNLNTNRNLVASRSGNRAFRIDLNTGTKSSGLNIPT